MLSCLDRLALQSNSQATARQKEIRQRDPKRFNGAYFRGCKRVFACAIKWLAPVEDVVRLFGAWILPSPFRSLKVIPSSCVDFRQPIHGCKCSVNWCFVDEGFFRGFSRRWAADNITFLHWQGFESWDFGLGSGPG
jgi:hypothetical protein